MKKLLALVLLGLSGVASLAIGPCERANLYDHFSRVFAPGGVNVERYALDNLPEEAVAEAIPGNAGDLLAAIRALQDAQQQDETTLAEMWGYFDEAVWQRNQALFYEGGNVDPLPWRGKRSIWRDLMQMRNLLIDEWLLPPIGNRRTPEERAAFFRDHVRIWVPDGTSRPEGRYCERLISMLPQRNEKERLFRHFYVTDCQAFIEFVVAEEKHFAVLPIGRIAFNSTRDGNSEIYVMNADGSAQIRLTNTPAWELGCSWSPDGRRMAFGSDREGNRDIYVMNADGSGQTRLTHSPGSDWQPAWSPDGGRIAFSSTRHGNAQIHVMNADGSRQTRLTYSAAGDIVPIWSPDSRRIAFTSTRDGNPEIYVMNADGTGQTRLTNNPTSDIALSWSPDGSRIAFFSNRDRNLDIYVMKADGSRQRRLTHNPALDRHPAWSPAGTHIAFASNRDGNWEIYVMRADGSAQTRLTYGIGEDDVPCWAPAP